ncbi:MULTISPECIES: flagellar protein FlaG [unclassified Pseudomonas]|uniref:flagellar protein FlaG n=1 Tax=unclassified Pseudomonas TaxID=196821 RepID=UPI0023D7FCDC|nr:flagellar protein FlaG [Pseudomonas sp. PSE14]WEJ70693.1 flagellar protein FlaG [Pseudomonas sp. PSE14]
MDVSKVTSIAGLGSFERTPSIRPVREAVTPDQAADQQDSKSLDSAVSDIQSFVQGIRRNLNFSIDDATGEVVVKVIDAESGKVVRQMPSEEVLKLAARLDDIRSLMFETRA